MKKARIVAVFVVIITISLFVGCAGKDGNAYQKYYWTWAPLYFYDTNPSTPAIIYNDTYFFSYPGSYYMEYTAWNGAGWYLYYTISINKGKLFENGKDFWYEIGLYSTGPTLYRYSSTKEITNEKAKGNETENTSIVLASEALPLQKGPIIGKEEREFDNGKITIEYGKLYK